MKFRRLSVILSVFVLLSACAQEEKPQKKESKAQPTLSHSQENVTYTTLGAAGDVLIHDVLYNKAKRRNGTYDFNFMFQDVAPYLRKPDIMMVNQESMIGGPALGISTYPSFNSPYEVGDALKANGVDLVTLANNHTLDRGKQAILNATNHWNKIGMPYTGAYASPNDAKKIRTITKNETTFAFLSYTYGTNGIPVPQNQPYLVNLIEPTTIAHDIRKAKKKADVVVLSLHFGNEYERMPTPKQKQLVQLAADAGANVIIGHHPHVLQPATWVKSKNGGSAFAIYSLGNFISGQRGNYKDIGGILTLTIKKITKNKHTSIEIENPAFLPTWVNKSWIIQPMKDIPAMKHSYDSIKQHMKQQVPKLAF
ncbi:hypothetical protein A374_10333 [Fictibacillus macauensis ZFHKF-1]|uniref:Capsule synthesis protein CapA domain-containing protein n=1 Tax=Fictibacillus macauensis ZFHKF-1 TaxID=1196324 RepID=I8J1L6_9BACL|nr:CapA family protein [Fictibacillus macauensis]EIT85626.1 hypothetical protein A374_10333 [Fictibacillus macauensis ZFHKF-1]